MQKYSVNSSSNLDRDRTRQDAVPANALIAEERHPKYHLLGTAIVGIMPWADWSSEGTLSATVPPGKGWVNSPGGGLGDGNRADASQCSVMGKDAGQRPCMLGPAPEPLLRHVLLATVRSRIRARRAGGATAAGLQQGALRSCKITACSRSPRSLMKTLS